jgi:Icc-related predicted phosphoesterase
VVFELYGFFKAAYRYGSVSVLQKFSYVTSLTFIKTWSPLNKAIFISDLHGFPDRYEKLFDYIRKDLPEAVFIGGDILPSQMAAFFKGTAKINFLEEFLIGNLRSLQTELGDAYPKIFIILGNDDSKLDVPLMEQFSGEGLWCYCHNRCIEFGGYLICGYSYVPPTPFRLKDWEKYDVSRYVDPGCISPESGMLTSDDDFHKKRFGTIQRDLEAIAEKNPITDKTIFLFHSPPYKTNLDLAALKGKMIDHVPLDPHVGSIAIERFIRKEQPLLTLHGHIHESSELTGSWRDMIGSTHCFNAAYNHKELSIIVFSPGRLEEAKRLLL